jgi:hypothetical protein
MKASTVPAAPFPADRPPGARSTQDSPFANLDRIAIAPPRSPLRASRDISKKARQRGKVARGGTRTRARHAVVLAPRFGRGVHSASESFSSPRLGSRGRGGFSTSPRPRDARARKASSLLSAP